VSIVFTGFMGAGKTTAAREAAAVLGVEAVDADHVFQDREGTSVGAFFAQHGEGEFRRREEALVLELLRSGAPVVSLGGGAVTSSRVRDALKRHTVVLMEIGVDSAWQRVSRSERPLGHDRARFAALLAERTPLYEAVADAVLPEGSVVARAAPVLAALPPGARLTWSVRGQYPVLVGAAGVREALPPAPGRRFVVTDEHVAAAVALPEGERFAMPAGEPHKTLATAGRVWRWLAGAGATRGDHVCAVGGGVVGDLAGFCAATYQRGVPVVQVPTTVVAQVDSALGGKTGVDLPEGKNYVGAYHQPAAVVADVTTLETLPQAEHAAGYAEVVKTALIAGGPLWERVRGGAPVDAQTVFACARTKLAVVAADERDGGLRQVLNLGHTVGHALETVTGYARLRHGEAVGLGLLAALRLSGQRELREEVAELLRRAGLPLTVDDVDAAAVVAATRRDKKRVGTTVPFVLLAEPGDVRPGATVPDREVEAAVRELIAA